MKYLNVRLHNHYSRLSKETPERCWKSCSQDAPCAAIAFNKDWVPNCYLYDYNFGFSLNSTDWVAYSLKKIDNLDYKLSEHSKYFSFLNFILLNNI